MMRFGGIANVLKNWSWILGFHPSVSIQRAGNAESNIIIYGDLLHVDFGYNLFWLNTDTQQHAYVLKAGEQQHMDIKSGF